jgi:RNA 2',3'-cyclic 3'-phosphodiesterase
MSVIRAFIAVDLSPEILSRIRDVSENIRNRMNDLPVRWVPVENIHLTLKFLGDVSVSNLEILQKVFREVVASHAACEISVGGLGAYPKINQPRVIWVGLEAPQELLSLQTDIEIESEKLGYPREERCFSPHLTIGRVPRNGLAQDIARLVRVLEESKVGFLGATRINNVNLYRSDLRPGGAVYTSLYSASLLQNHAGK